MWSELLRRVTPNSPANSVVWKPQKYTMSPASMAPDRGVPPRGNCSSRYSRTGAMLVGGRVPGPHIPFLKGWTVTRSHVAFLAMIQLRGTCRCQTYRPPTGTARLSQPVSPCSSLRFLPLPFSHAESHSLLQLGSVWPRLAVFSKPTPPKLILSTPPPTGMAFLGGDLEDQSPLQGTLCQLGG